MLLLFLTCSITCATGLIIGSQSYVRKNCGWFDYWNETICGDDITRSIYGIGSAIFGSLFGGLAEIFGILAIYSGSTNSYLALHVITVSYNLSVHLN